MVEKEAVKRSPFLERVQIKQQQEESKREGPSSKAKLVMTAVLLSAALLSSISIDKQKRAPVPPVTNRANIIAVSPQLIDTGEHTIPKADLKKTRIEVKDTWGNSERITFERNGNMMWEISEPITDKSGRSSVRKYKTPVNYSSETSIGIEIPTGSIDAIFDKQPDGSVKVTWKEYGPDKNP